MKFFLYLLYHLEGPLKVVACRPNASKLFFQDFENRKYKKNRNFKGKNDEKGLKNTLLDFFRASNTVSIKNIWHCVFKFKRVD